MAAAEVTVLAGVMGLVVEAAAEAAGSVGEGVGAKAVAKEAVPAGWAAPAVED